MREVVIVDSVRTGLAKSFRGKFNQTRPDDMAAHCVNALLSRNGLDPASVEDCIVGAGSNEGAQGYNIGRNVAVLSQLGTGTAGMTLNRFCSSGLQAIAIACNPEEQKRLRVMPAVPVPNCESTATLRPML